MLQRRNQMANTAQRGSFSKTPQKSPIIKQTQVKYRQSRDFEFEEEDEEDEEPKYQPRYKKHRKHDVRRKYSEDSDDDMSDSEIRQLISDLKKKNRKLKVKVQMLQKDLIKAQTRENDDGNQYLVSENEELRAQLKDERVKNRLAQESIRSLENDIKTKERIIETKELMIKRLQITCQEQANEYTKVAEQLKLQVTNFNVPPLRGSSFANTAGFGQGNSVSLMGDGFDDLGNQPPARDSFRNQSRFDDGFDDNPPPPPRRDEKDAFMDAFDDNPPPLRNRNFDNNDDFGMPPPPLHSRADDEFSQRGFDNGPPYNDVPSHRDGPPFNDPLPPPRGSMKPPTEVPEGFRGGNYSEDMPIRGVGAPPLPPQPQRQMDFSPPPPPRRDFPPPNRFNDFDDYDDNPSGFKNAEDIRKEIDKIMPRKNEIERKLNLALPKGKDAAQAQQEKDRLEEELSQINKRISGLKLQLRKMR